MVRRRGSRGGLWIALLAAALAASACGTAEVGVHLIVDTGGEIEMTLRAEGSGQVMQAIVSTIQPEGLRREGWEVNTGRQGENTFFEARVRSTEGSNPAALMGADVRGVERHQGLFWEEYALRLPFEGFDLMPLLEGRDTGGLSSEDITRALNAALRFGASITLPGRIVESNADEVQGSTATWRFRASEIGQARELYARSRRTRVERVALAVALPLLALGVVLTVLIRRRRHDWARGEYRRR